MKNKTIYIRGCNAEVGENLEMHRFEVSESYEMINRNRMIIRFAVYVNIVGYQTAGHISATSSDRKDREESQMRTETT